MKHSIFPLLFTLLLVQSCKKDKNDHDDHDDDVAPTQIVIHQSSPDKNQVYGANDTVFVRLNVEANGEMHGFGYNIKPNDSTNNVFSVDKQYTHGTTYTIDTFWVNTFNGTIPSQFQFYIYTDHTGSRKTYNTAITL